MPWLSTYLVREILPIMASSNLLHDPPVPSNKVAWHVFAEKYLHHCIIKFRWNHVNIDFTRDLTALDCFLPSLSAFGVLFLLEELISFCAVFTFPLGESDSHNPIYNAVRESVAVVLSSVLRSECRQ